MTLVESDNISVPAIKEFPLTLECRVIVDAPICGSLPDGFLTRKDLEKLGN